MKTTQLFFNPKSYNEGDEPEAWGRQQDLPNRVDLESLAGDPTSPIFLHGEATG